MINMSNAFTRRRGFTLVEALIYIVLAALAFTFIIGIGQDLLLGSVKIQGEREVSFNARTAINLITQKIRGANDVVLGSSTFNSSPGVLTITYPGVSPSIIFDTYNKTLTKSTGGTYVIRKLRMKEGTAAAVDLTNDKINITNFVVRNLTKSTEAHNINVELTFTQANPANDPNLNASISVETAISLRH
jgi:type II secretory pathway pseudopilin PulG